MCATVSECRCWCRAPDSCGCRGGSLDPPFVLPLVRDSPAVGAIRLRVSRFEAVAIRELVLILRTVTAVVAVVRVPIFLIADRIVRVAIASVLPALLETLLIAVVIRNAIDPVVAVGSVGPVAAVVPVTAVWIRGIRIRVGVAIDPIVVAVGIAAVDHARVVGARRDTLGVVAIRGAWLASGRHALVPDAAHAGGGHLS